MHSSGGGRTQRTMGVSGVALSHAPPTSCQVQCTHQLGRTTQSWHGFGKHNVECGLTADFARDGNLDSSAHCKFLLFGLIVLSAKAELAFPPCNWTFKRARFADDINNCLNTAEHTCLSGYRGMHVHACGFSGKVKCLAEPSPKAAGP